MDHPGEDLAGISDIGDDREHLHLLDIRRVTFWNGKMAGLQPLSELAAEIKGLFQAPAERILVAIRANGVSAVHRDDINADALGKAERPVVAWHACHDIVPRKGPCGRETAVFHPNIVVGDGDRRPDFGIEGEYGRIGADLAMENLLLVELAGLDFDH